MTSQPDHISPFDEKQLGKARDIHLIRKLGPFLAPYRLLFAASLVLSILITGTEMAIPYVTKLAIDRHIVPRAEAAGGVDAPLARRFTFDLSEPRTAQIVAAHPDLFQVREGRAVILWEEFKKLPRKDMAALRRPDLEGIVWAAGFLLVMVGVGFALTFINTMVMEYAGQMVMHDLRMRLFTHIQGLSVGFFNRNPVGRLVTRVTSDTQNMHEMFTNVLVYSIKDLFMLAAIMAVLLYLDGRLALAVFGVFPFVFWAAGRFTASAREAFRTLRVKIAEINTRFSETIGGMAVIQLFNQEEANFQAFQKTNQEHYAAGMRQITVFALFMPLMEMMSSVALAVVIYYGGARILDDRLTLGALVVFISYIRMFFRPIRDIAEKYNITLNALSSAERLFLILEDETRIPEPEKPALPPPRGQGVSVCFDHVCFSHSPGEKILKDICLDIGAGETVAVVGPTGAGKTTLANLMMRFYEPDAGVIRISGVDIRNLRRHDLRARISVVTQDPCIFSATVKDNIFPEASRFTESEIADILSISHCKAIVERLPLGLDTVLSGGGAALSSGERQLLSIARALAHRPELIIFDEATSYVDSETERNIQEALVHLSKNRTTVIIAHRLSTARSADRILVMREGRIVENGPHDALMAQKSFYYRLNNCQG